MAARLSFRETLAALEEPRFLIILFLGFSSGLPLALTGSTLFVWMREAEVDLTTIGLFAALGTPYTLKFLWAPVVDHLSLPVLSRRLGHRRSWMILSQAALIAGLFLLGSSNPADEPLMTAALAFAVAFSSATQDIVIDAYRVEILARRQLAVGAAMVTYGYRVGMLAAGAGALYLAAFHGWQMAYAVMAAGMLVGVVTVLLAPEPAHPEGLITSNKPLSEQLEIMVVAPFAEFMSRRGWMLILLFIVLFKFGDSLAGTMTNPFLIDLEFTKTEIANVVKIFGFAATMAGLAAGGVLMVRVGLFWALMASGLLQLATNLVFVAQAVIGHDVSFLAVTIGFENLAGGMGTAVFVAYLSALCNFRFTATHYALLSSLSAVARTWLSTSGGALAEAFGWIPFFVLTTVAAVPGILLLLWLWRVGLGVPDLRDGEARA